MNERGAAEQLQRREVSASTAMALKVSATTHRVVVMQAPGRPVCRGLDRDC